MINIYRRPRQRGFTLVEVLVALVVTAVGLLGLLKIQALAISSTKEAGGRGLVAMQVESLTAMMHANPFYWAAAVPAGGITAGPPPATITFAAATGVDGPLGSAGAACAVGAKCTPLQLAALDLQTWAAAMAQQFPTYSGQIKCTTSPLPVQCAIYVNWQETQVAANATTALGTTKQTSSLSFSVYVQP